MVELYARSLHSSTAIDTWFSQMPLPVSTRRSFTSIDGLRGVAAILVTAFHYNSIIRPLIAHSAYLAVDAFFLVSGFVIAAAYGTKLTESLSVQEFIKLRFIRLYPLYILGTTLGFVVLVISLATHFSAKDTLFELLRVAVPAIVMLPTPPTSFYTANPDSVSGMINGVFIAAPLYPLNGPAWSLFFELFINILYSLIVPIRRITLYMIVAISGIMLLAVAFSRDAIIEGWGWPAWWVGFVRVSFSFFLGVAFYRGYISGRLRRISCPPLIVLLVSAGILCAPVPFGIARTLYDAFAVVIALPMLCWLCICNEPKYPQAYSILGLLSFPIYAIHVPVRSLVERLVPRILHRSLESYSPWGGLLLLPTVIVISYILATTYDLWMRRILTRRVGVRR